MSNKIELSKTLCALPNVSRGYGYHMYATTKKNAEFIYGSDRGVQMRNLEKTGEGGAIDWSNGSTYSMHKSNVKCANYSPNGEWVASADAEGKVLVWGRKNHMQKSEIPALGSEAHDIAWDADGKRIVVVGAGTKSYSKVFSWDTGSALGSVGNHSDGCISVDYRKVRPYAIASASEDNTINFHKGPPFKYDHSFKEHSRYPNKIKYSPDGEFLVSVGSDSKIFVFEAKAGEKIREISDPENGHKTSAIWGFDWSPDGKNLITVSADKSAKIWDFESGKVLKTFHFSDHSTADDQQMSALWTDNAILTVSLSGAINVLDEDNTEKPKYVVHGHKAKINTIETHTASGKFFTSCAAGKVSVWTNEHARWLTGKGHGGAVHLLSVSSDGKVLATIGSDDKIRFNALESGAFSENAFALGKRGKSLASGKSSNMCIAGVANKLHIFKDGELSKSVDMKYTPISICFNNDDSLVAIGGDDKKVYVYKPDGDFSATEKTVENIEHQATMLRYSPCGNYLAVTQKNGTTIFDKEWKKLNNGWEAHSMGVTGASWNPSGTKFVTVAPDLNVVCFYDCKTFKSERVCNKMSHNISIMNCAFIDENRVLSIGADDCMKIWTV